MKNIYRTKKKVNFSINSNLVEKFNLLADKKSINKSKLIENFIQIWINENV